MPYLKNEPVMTKTSNRGAKRSAWDENFPKSSKNLYKKGIPER
jgi:hypothetical protein